VERKESARRWQHISVRRCLDATDTRVSKLLEANLLLILQTDRESCKTTRSFFLRLVIGVT